MSQNKSLILERGEMMQEITYYNSPVGKILLASDDLGLTGLWLHSDRFYADNLTEDHQLGTNNYLADAIKWLDLYFAGKNPNFLPKLHLIGTNFQNQVWLALLEIPYGEVTTYKKIAEKVAGRTDHLPIRAVGGAVGRNHIALIVPCHRVIGSNGNLTGYGGGIDKKIQLLQLEGIDISKFSLPANYK